MADSKLIHTQTEKPNHYTYLKEFRVEQCPSFLQHKCNQHRPFICFNWHFMNQRRRRPVRRRDGTFNYSADNYCTKYDETTGICPDGDECPFLHRTAGDTERRYHLRYYKTCMCVHDTDARGYCVKNGTHCAFAHGVHDQRPPVYDIKEIEALQSVENSAEAIACSNGNVANGGPNVLDKERNLMNEDPKWQDTNYVLANYKTEPCKRPPRLCRQGYACPQYHNSKDKRRSPRKFKYRSTPCPNVKHGEEWGEPNNCEAGENCQYCHTRTEQQFHPEIYKSTKCNDVQQAGYCPRSVFCAFAHVEQEVPLRELEGGLTLCELFPNGIPGQDPTGLTATLLMKKDKCNELGVMPNGNAESSESASTSSLGSNNSSQHNKAPGAQLHHQKSSLLSSSCNQNNIMNSSANNSNNNNSLLNNLSSSMGGMSYADYASDMTKQILAIENDLTLNQMEKDQRKRICLSYMRNISLDGVANNALDEINRRDSISLHLDNSISAGITSSGLLQNSSAPVNIPGSTMASSLSNNFKSLLQSAPVNIPGSSLTNFSPTNHHHIFSMPGPHTGHTGSSAPKLNNSFGHTDTSVFFQSHLISPSRGGGGGVGEGGLSLSPDIRIAELNSLNSDLTNSTTNTLFDNHLQQQTKHHPYSVSPLVSHTEIGRLRDELATKNAQMMTWEGQTNKMCEVWKTEIEDSSRKYISDIQTQIAEQQRDEALGHVKVLKEKLDQLSMPGTTIRASELRGMPLQKLKALQAKLRTELEEVEKVLYSETATKCMKCEENNRSVTLAPCNHYVLCEICSRTVIECPYCQTPVTSQT